MNTAPITLFVYNRLSHTEQTVESLKRNIYSSYTDLFIFSDGARKGDESRVNEVREYLKSIDGFKSVTVYSSEKNKGLANSIIDGVTKIINKFGKVIVVEDDLITAKGFLKYMNDALALYECCNDVISIHGYNYPLNNKKLPETFFIKGADCWGWATWKRGWDLFEADGQKLYNELSDQGLLKKFDFDRSFNYTQMLLDQIHGKNNSWAIRWNASAFLNNKLTLYPCNSLVQNIGIDGSGTHFNNSNEQYKIDFNDQLVLDLKKIVIEESFSGRKAFIRYFKSLKEKHIVIKRLFRGARRRLNKILNR